MRTEASDTKMQLATSLSIYQHQYMFSRIERSERRVNFGLFRLRGIVLSVMSVVAMVEVIRPLVTVSQIGCLKRKDLLE